MKTQSEWLATNYPRAIDAPLADYIRLAYLEYAVSELISEVEALKPKPPVLVELKPADEDVTPAYTSNPLICHCEDFVGDNFECERCGGMLF